MGEEIKRGHISLQLLLLLLFSLQDPTATDCPLYQKKQIQTMMTNPNHYLQFPISRL